MRYRPISRLSIVPDYQQPTPTSENRSRHVYVGDGWGGGGDGVFALARESCEVM
jgi:hypothetical protein